MYRSYYDHAKQTWRQELEPLSDEEIDFATMNWLTRTIGILVMKGYLRIVPQIELGD